MRTQHEKNVHRGSEWDKRTGKPNNNEKQTSIHYPQQNEIRAFVTHNKCFLKRTCPLDRSKICRLHMPALQQFWTSSFDPSTQNEHMHKSITLSNQHTWNYTGQVKPDRCKAITWKNADLEQRWREKTLTCKNANLEQRWLGKMLTWKNADLKHTLPWTTR